MSDSRICVSEPVAATSPIDRLIHQFTDVSDLHDRADAFDVTPLELRENKAARARLTDHIDLTPIRVARGDADFLPENRNEAESDEEDDFGETDDLPAILDKRPPTGVDAKPWEASGRSAPAEHGSPRTPPRTRHTLSKRSVVTATLAATGFIVLGASYWTSAIDQQRAQVAGTKIDQIASVAVPLPIVAAQADRNRRRDASKSEIADDDVPTPTLAKPVEADTKQIALAGRQPIAVAPLDALARPGNEVASAAAPADTAAAAIESILQIGFSSVAQTDVSLSEAVGASLGLSKQLRIGDAGSRGAAFPLYVEVGPISPGQPAATTVLISGLPEKTIFSSGTSVGATAWSLVLTETRDLRIWLGPHAQSSYRLDASIFASDGSLLGSEVLEIVRTDHDSSRSQYQSGATNDSASPAVQMARTERSETLDGQAVAKRNETFAAEEGNKPSRPQTEMAAAPTAPAPSFALGGNTGIAESEKNSEPFKLFGVDVFKPYPDWANGAFGGKQ